MNEQWSEEKARRARQRTAAEEMALRARELGTSVADLFAGSYEVRFRTSGHTDSETIEHVVDVTPDLIAKAEAILEGWSR